MKAVWTAFHRGVRVILCASSFFFFFLGGALLAWLVFPIVGLFVRERVARARKCQNILRASFRLFHGYMRWMQVLHFRPRDVVASLPDGPCVVIANHPTLVDVTALVSVLGQVSIVAKRSMFRSPLVGRLLRYGWHIEAAADPVADGPRVLRECAERLAAGLRILIFPEGTRSPIGGLHPFKRGALEAAARAEVPVVQFQIRCEPGILSRQHPWWSTPAKIPRFTLTQLPTLDPRAWGGNAKAMARAIEVDYSRRMSASPSVNAALQANV